MTALEADLAKWIAEFNEVGGNPDKLPSFLAKRLRESGVVSDDTNVVRARVGSGGAVRRIEVHGFQYETGHVLYNLAEDGYLGSGMCRVADVLDNAKLAGILDRLEGK